MSGREPVLGEFDVIALFQAACGPARPWVRAGIGDDCAVLDLDAERCLLVTTDLLVEGIHYLRGTTTPWQLGWKALAVNVSDVAAMGGRPLAAFLGLGMAEAERGLVEGLRDGLLACARVFGVDLLGGDTVRTPRDGLLSITLLGEVTRAELLLRSGARPGDAVFVGRPVGESAAGLWLTTAGAAQAERLGDAPRRALFGAHLEPQPQVELGRWLARRGLASAAIDVSDGLLQDLGRLCAASGVGARIEAGAFPLGGALGAAAALPGAPAALEWALRGGEDYALLFTVPPDRAEALAAEAQAVSGARPFRCGTIEAEPGLRLVQDGRSAPVEPRGWDHFAAR